MRRSYPLPPNRVVLFLHLSPLRSSPSPEPRYARRDFGGPPRQLHFSPLQLAKPTPRPTMVRPAVGLPLSNLTPHPAALTPHQVQAAAPPLGSTLAVSPIKTPSRSPSGGFSFDLPRSEKPSPQKRRPPLFRKPPPPPSLSALRFFFPSLKIPSRPIISLLSLSLRTQIKPSPLTKSTLAPSGSSNRLPKPSPQTSSSRPPLPLAKKDLSTLPLQQLWPAPIVPTAVLAAPLSDAPNHTRSRCSADATAAHESPSFA